MEQNFLYKGFRIIVTNILTWLVTKLDENPQKFLSILAWIGIGLIFLFAWMILPYVQKVTDFLNYVIWGA